MMLNYLLPRLENILEVVKRDFRIIAKKNQDDEWKRSHYMYAFTINAQRMYELLNSQLTERKTSPPALSTKREMIALRNQLDKIINS